MSEPQYYPDKKSGRKFKTGDYQTRMKVARPKGGYILSTANSGRPADETFDPPKVRRRGRRKSR